jgi:hypothetical protein
VTDFAAGGCCCRERSGGGVAGEHAEAWAECCDVCFVEDVGDVIHCDPSIARQALDLELRNALVGAVACAEV